MTREESIKWIINISADIGKTEHKELWHYEQALAEIKGMLEAEPTQKTGHWIPWKAYYGKDRKSWSDELKCSECGYKWGDEEYRFCPNCGAKMKEE